MPSVTISECTPKYRMKNALIAPTAAPHSSAMMIAGPMSTFICTLRTAIRIELSPMTEATDRSKSPLVSGIISAKVSTTTMALEPNIEA